MAKLPYMQFYPGDWLLDTHILSPATRGIWMDILCFMWREEPRTGTLEYTSSGWCKRLRCSDAELRTAVMEMETENICKIMKDEDKDSVRFTSRRIARDEKMRKANRLYVSRHRSKLPCKDVVSDVKGVCKGENQNQSHISESESEVRKEEEKRRPRVSVKRSPLPDEEWFNNLKQNSAYTGLDIDREKAKCETWCITNGKLFSRRRFVNWLNGAERPLTRLPTPKPVLVGPKAFQKFESVKGDFAPMPEDFIDRIGKPMPTLREA